MTSGITPVNLDTINLPSDSNGIKIIKIVKLPDERVILDVMFISGLRLTIDTGMNMNADEIERDLKLEVSQYRNSQLGDHDAAITTISHFLATVTESGETIKFDGKSKKKIIDNWSESFFFSWMRNNNFVEKYPLELINEVVYELYGTVST